MTRHITLAEYFWLAEQVTGVPAAVLAKAARADLADSALHAPSAGFGDEGLLSRPLRAAVLAWLAWNHPLPDGNKRAAWVSLVMFIDLNGGRTPILPMSTRQKRRCSPSPLLRSTRHGSRAGCGNGCHSND